MDSPMSDANNQIIISGVSSKSHEEQGSTSIDQGESSESAAPAADEPPPPPPPPGGGAGNYQLAIVDHDREYGCRYCHKKFSNKQALGGHQNAHKVERAMEKNEQETAAIGYYGGGPNSYPARINVPAPFLNSYPRPHDFLHRSLFSWSCGGRAVPYNSRPAAEPYAPFPAAAEYSGWSAPRAPSFAARPHFTLPAPNMNIRLPNFGAGSSRAFRPVSNHQGPSGFPALPIRLGGNNRPVGPLNLRNIPADQHDESGLDLSLKLG